MHGNLNFDVPYCDILLIAGDICPSERVSVLSCGMQADWFYGVFTPWLEKQPCMDCVAVAGNHDWVFQDALGDLEMPEKFSYLCEDSVTIGGVKIYGTPYQPMFCNWAFNVGSIELHRRFQQIPMDTNILLTHTPPLYIMDLTDSMDSIGSDSLRVKVDSMKNLLHVFGHNHGMHGVQRVGKNRYVNASLLNEQYQMVNKPIVINYRVEV